MGSIFRGSAIAFLVAMFWLYFWLLSNPIQQVDTIDDVSFQFDYSTLATMNWALAALAVLQLYMLLQSLVYSLQARELTFTSPLRSSESEARSDATLWLLHCWTRFTTKWIEPVLYINDKHFDRYFLFREDLKVASQVYQGYQMSVYIPTRWMNELFVFMIFVNCISTHIIHWLVPCSKTPLRRLLSVVCSTFLNFINSVLIAFIIFIPYPFKYDALLGSFLVEYLYDDVWYARAIRENQQHFVTSYVDFLATWAPHWGLFSCLVACGDLVRRRRHHANGHSRRDHPSNTSTTVVVPAWLPWRRPDASKVQANPPSRATIARMRMAYHGLVFVGMVTLAIHIVAQSPASVEGCNLVSTPWLETDSSCVILNVNCYRRQIQGTEHEIDDILSKVSAKHLFQLILTHCPRLQVPPCIQQFYMLTGLDVCNCTLDAWRDQAALDQTHHPNLVYVAAYLTNLTSLPAGLLSNNFPSRLHVVYLFETNLTSPRPDLFTFWPLVSEVLLDFSPMHGFPSAVAKLPSFIQLSFINNRIERIDDGSEAARSLFENPNMQYLRLSKSPLQALSSHCIDCKMDQWDVLLLEATQVTQVPKFIRDWLLHRQDQVVHSLYGSPYCNETLVVIPQYDPDQREYPSKACAAVPRCRTRFNSSKHNNRSKCTPLCVKSTHQELPKQEYSLIRRVDLHTRGRKRLHTQQQQPALACFSVPKPAHRTV